ncbi:Putative acetolactate synthase large subunit IlvX [Rubrivivax sp. A210]|uniref:acetolactate synthase large subunit n=1 Tax=Rubrivivax sp. A210 TaxID=2772301 RepID=UPI00191A6AC1|nr:acetolactate synthase large subunit [Rubrivivax sp. A210]CAD5372199.1 Putative acetolactate synthase large subunit IlvX [Rubrivivax sp. A210]
MDKHPSPPLNGAESLVATLAASGVELCFANPGTSEMHFVAALDRRDGPRCVLALFEGVATAAADGYWRMAGKPAATLLHLGPGLGNGLANLHNARKARSGLVNIVGDHALDHARLESPLKGEAEAIARTVSHWVRSSTSAADVGADGAAALQATRDGAVGRIATLLLPADTAWGVGGRAAVAPSPLPPQAPTGAVAEAARLLTRLGPRALLLLGAGGAASVQAQHLAAAIAERTGCRLMAEFYNARMPGGRGRPRIERLPYNVDAAQARLAGLEALVLAGSVEPIAFFAYPGKPSQLKPPGAALLSLAEPRHDVTPVLQALAHELGATAAAAPFVLAPPDAAIPIGPLTPDTLAAVVAATLPADAVVVDESVSSGRGLGGPMAAAAPHDWLAVMGGAIGFGLPGAVGASLGAPGRPVLVLEGDGSAMYTVQALWTMARESLPIVVLILANRAYRILQAELQGVGARLSGDKAAAMLSLDGPALDWVALARGHGLPATRVDSAEGLARALREGFASNGPCLIEALL